MNIPKGTTVYYMINHTECGAFVRLFIAINGMPDQSGEIEEITHRVAKVTKIRYKPEKGLYRKGHGYNHGADCVEELSYKLFGNVTELKKKQL